MQLPFLGTVPAPPLPFLQARYITTYCWCGAVEVSSAWELPVPPPGRLFTHCQCFSQLPGSDPDFLPWISGCPQGIWDFVPWLVPLPLLGMLSFFCLYNFYCPSTPEKFPALTAGWAEAFSWCVKTLTRYHCWFSLCRSMCRSQSQPSVGDGCVCGGPDLCLTLAQ